uniref:Chemokine (C-C motif) ligand 39, duplicate 1 n=1 Tax=Cyprinus carpio TaxID=7962 RepID=A0A8C1J7R7_CYPCA
MIKLTTFVLFLHILTGRISLDGAISKCCGEEFSNVKIPVKLLTSYYRTSSSCPRRAIVFQTEAGKEFCVDPESTWVRSHVDKVDKRTTV